MNRLPADRITRADAWILDSADGSWRHLALERADLVVALDDARRGRPPRPDHE